MDKLKAMRVFVEVVEQGSMSAAAQRLGVVNSVVSRNLAELENWLQKKLIQRSTRSLRLTADGKHYLQQCREILDYVAALEEPAEQRQEQIHGNVRITAPLLQGRFMLGPAIASFRQLHPFVSIDFVLDNNYRPMIDDGFDIALRISSLPDSNLVARKICDITLKLVASPGYLEKHAAPLTPRDISQHDCLLEGRGEYIQRWRFIAHNNRQISISPKGQYQISDPELIVDLCKVDMGLAHLPNHFLDADIARGNLVELLPEYRYTRLYLHLLYHRKKHTAQAVKVMIDFLIDFFEKNQDQY